MEGLTNKVVYIYPEGSKKDLLYKLSESNIDS